MSYSYYKVLWLLVHALVSLFEAIFHFGLEFRENFCNFIKKISQSRCNHTSKSDRLLIENQLHELKKLPKHLGVILSASSEKDVDVQKLTRLVTWALSSGINFISFYDYKGEAATMLHPHHPLELRGQTPVARTLRDQTG